MNPIENNPRSNELLAGSDLIQREARLIDDAQWSEWITLFTQDCIFWTPSWRSDGTLTENPMREVSHIYIVGRGGLHERVSRIGSSLAAASVPMQRTTHLLSGSQRIASAEPGHLRLRTSWNSHVHFPRTHQNEVFFGHYEHDLVWLDDDWRIAHKKVILKNDYIPTLMDVYCI